MRKVQFFLLIETTIVTLAIFDALANPASRDVLLFSAALLAIWYALGSKLDSILFISGLSLAVLVLVLNPYFILAGLLGMLYILINFFARSEKKNQYTHVVLDSRTSEVKKEKSQWFGSHNYSQDQAGFEDINLIRLVGNDIIDLDQTILVGRDNVVVIRKTFGQTKIIIPIDVEVTLSAASLYGRVQFLNTSFWDLRNESISVASPGYQDAHRRVKVVVNSLYGDVEVVRV